MAAPTKATSRDVARRAGVSRSAVSRVFTPGASVSEEMSRKVRKAATELGYRPNVLARSLITGNSRIIGILVAYLDNYFYPQAIQALSRQLQDEGYHVLMFMADSLTADLDGTLREILDYQVDGLILASVAMGSGLAEQCQEAGVPVVLFNRTQPGAAMSSIASDNVAGGRLLAEFLLAGGHRRIGYIAGWEGASTQSDREAGFIAGLTAGGARLHSREVGDFTTERAELAARKMFDRPDRPDAVFVANDHMAFAVMDVLRSELGLDVPGDVSVVSYDDVPPAAWKAYDLTTMRQPTRAMAHATVSTLLHQMSGEQPEPVRMALESTLMVRTSARVPDGWGE